MENKIYVEESEINILSQEKGKGIISEIEKQIKYYNKNPFPEKTKQWFSQKYKAFINFINPDGKIEDEVNIEIINKFKKPDLLDEIKKELDKDHKEDNNLKLTTFLIAISGLQKNSKRRISEAVTSDSSVGKDNLFKTVLKHLPSGVAIFLTNATQPTLEDDIKDKRIICYSEMNKFREEGANKHLVEAIKQMAEGGMSALKKDIRNGMKTARHEEDEQKTVLYGTTEEERDEELETRFLCAGMKYSYQRGRTVSFNTLDTISDINKLLLSCSDEDSWIKKGLNYLYYQKESFDDVWIPYANLLKEIDGEDIFNFEDPRVQRDVKRIMNLTSAITWLYQEQRFSFKLDGKNILVSYPEDFIKAIELSEEFFNETYTGIDQRLNQILEIMKKYSLKELKDDYEKLVPRDYIEKELGKAKNTIKRRMKILSDKGLVEGMSGRDLGEGYDANKIYYKRCQKGIKKVLIRCQISKIKERLKEFNTEILIPYGYPLDTLLIEDNKGNKENKEISKEGVKSSPLCADSTKNPKIDTLELTPLDNDKPEVEVIKIKTNPKKNILSGLKFKTGNEINKEISDINKSGDAEGVNE